jgi:hypothetical protein
LRKRKTYRIGCNYVVEPKDDEKGAGKILSKGVEKMREIKFRVWSKSRQEMIYPSFGWFKKVYIGDNGFLQDIQLGTAIGLNGTKLELLQYIGLKDKNGNEIYESDLIEDNVGIGSVKFVNGAYRVNYRNGSYKWFIDFLDSEKKQLEVIGNIFN